MKKTVIALSLAAMTLPAIAAEPDYEISGNFALTSDYRFRGVSQTDKDPALQGGFDFAHKSGFYLGTWASNVSNWANPGGSMELDIYGGYSGELAGGIGYDIGYIAYRYPGNKPSLVGATAVSNNTGEYYVGLSYGPVSYKFSRTRTNWFGIDESKGSTYHDIGAEFSPVENLTLSAHAGFQKIKGKWATGEDASFKDFSVSASYDLGNGYAVSLTATSVDFKKSSAKGWFTSAESYIVATGGTTKLYEDATVLTISKSF